MKKLSRRERRYQNRRNKRLENLKKRNAQIGELSDLFSFSNMMKRGMKCTSGVMWKQSTQNFKSHLISGSAHRRRCILYGNWKPKPCSKFRLSERGKTRDIDAPHISDRHIQ